MFPSTPSLARCPLRGCSRGAGIQALRHLPLHPRHPRVRRGGGPAPVAAGRAPVHSIHSRETLALALRDGERVKSLKPIGFLPERTVIVDDLWRVWPFDRANLLLCPP